MEARAINRYIGSSPRKMRLVIDLIRGKNVDEALHILHFSPKHASKVAEKALRSAVSNLQNQDGGGRLEPEQMTVKAVSVDVGMTMKRISPAPMGRAFRIRKRSHHLTVVVAAMEDAVSAGRAKPSKREEPKHSRKAEGTGTRKTAARKGEGKPAEEGTAGTKTT
jgi:large subunit ribosomal protein L22